MLGIKILQKNVSFNFDTKSTDNGTSTCEVVNTVGCPKASDFVYNDKLNIFFGDFDLENVFLDN